MNKTLYWYIGGALVAILAIFLLSRSKKEKFRIINDEKGKTLLDQIKSSLTYLTDSSRFEFSDELEPLRNRNVMNEISLEEGFKSFTENKQRVTLCLRNQFGELYDQNSLMYVALHELAHVINDEVHHTKKFRRIFDALLKHASANGFYDPSKAFVKNYCS